MTDAAQDAIRWDETVDVICVGTGPGVQAYAICAAAADLDVLVVYPPAEPDERTAAWYSAMTADLDPVGEGDPGFSFARVVPDPEPVGKRPVLPPFVGEHLRQWSAQCVGSPFGMVFTEVPDLLLPTHTEGGGIITVAVIGQDAEFAAAKPENHMAAMVFEEGRIAGVELDDGSLVAATRGLVLPAGGDAVTARDLPFRDGYVAAIVGRPAGRFATVDLLRP